MDSIDKKGALAMGRKNFIAGMLKTKPIKDMGELGETYLNNYFDELESAKQENKRHKPDKGV